MDACVDCGTPTNTYLSSVGPICQYCRKKRDQQRILDKSANVVKCSDFNDWNGHDLSELFWIHLSRYREEPNKDSYFWIEMTLRWACHADHGLSNSFHHALRWADIDLFTEGKKWRSK